MTIENDTDSVMPPCAREAAMWSARLHSGSFSAREHAELARWRQSDPGNEREFQSIERLGGMAAALPKSKVQALYGGNIPKKPDGHRRRVLHTGLALASTAGIAVGVGLAMRPRAQADYATQLSTRKGERRNVRLPDGSILEMNTDTIAEVAFYSDTRRVELRQGEIMFSVAANVDMPFVIETGLGEVRVTGTRFSVRRDPSKVSVVVESGSVEVSSGRWWRRNMQRLTAGQGTSFDQRGVLTVADHIDVAAATAWRNGRLIFRNSPLSNVVDEVNRYLAQPIRLTDTRIQRLRVTASFRLGDSGILIDSLRQVAPVEVRHLPDGSVALVARQP